MHKITLDGVARRFVSLMLTCCLLFSYAYTWADPTQPGASQDPVPASEAETDIGAEDLSETDGSETAPEAVQEPQAPIQQVPADPAPPSPTVALNNDGYPLVQSFAPSLPDSFRLNLLYNRYLTNYDYALPKSGVGIRTGPGGAYDFIRTPGTYEKMSLVDSVRGEYLTPYNSDLWYRIYWYDKTGIRTGYVYGPLITVRSYDLSRKMAEAKAVQADLASAATIGYVNNYKNRRGVPPKLPGGGTDAFGNESSQSAPGYASLKDLTKFVYVQDGTLLLIIGQSGGYYQCRLPGKQTVYWIPQKYITLTTAMKQANQFIVVDRKQQNSAVFQKTPTGWELISYQVVTTGANDKYRFPTPLGAFMAVEKKPKFLYLHDITQEVDGYAPHAIRFSGGGYTHGVPVTFKKDPVTGQLVDPGMAENLATLGTIPRSHKCIRNTTSHALFLYEWAKIGQLAVIVIE